MNDRNLTVWIAEPGKVAYIAGFAFGVGIFTVVALFVLLLKLLRFLGLST